MSSLTTWMRRHSETLALLLLIALAILAATGIAFILILLMNLWRVW